MTLHLIDRAAPVEGVGQAALDACAQIRRAVESSRICRHLGGAMVSRIQEAVDLVDASLISVAKAEREISAAENFALALAPVAQG